jgi:hypothetical protein
MTTQNPARGKQPLVAGTTGRAKEDTIMRTKRVVLLLTVLFFIGFTGRVDALPITSTLDLNFHAPTQSFWGPGGSHLNFEKSGTFGTKAGITYEAKASTGTVTADFNGDLSVLYDDQLDGPGTANLDLSFSGDPNGGLLDTLLGASLGVDWFVDVDIPDEVDWLPWVPDRINKSGELYSLGYSLDIDETFTPAFHSPVSGNDEVAIEGISTEGIFVDVGLDLEVDQTANFRAKGIQGVTRARHRDSGMTSYDPFFLDVMLTNLSVPIELPKAGYWDISFVDLDLLNDFSTGFDLELEPYIEVDAIVWSKRWDIEVPGISIYDTPTFSLAFDSLYTQEISILVTPEPVPEPTTIALFGIGLLSLFALARKRQRMRK